MEGAPRSLAVPQRKGTLVLLSPSMTKILLYR